MTKSTNQSIQPYGSWPAAITSSTLTEQSVRLGEPQLDQGNIYWLEQRPEEQGRSVIVCQPEDLKQSRFDVTSPTMNVRTKAHEYGGGSYLVKNNTVYFINNHDQRIYQQAVDGSSEPLVLSPEGNYRYADLYLDHHRQQLLCVCERHRDIDNKTEPENSIVSLRLDGSSVIGLNVLVFGNDFYSNPSVSPDGEKLAWLTWSHPNMPWDNTECWIADFNSVNMLHKQRKVAGSTGKNGESVFQPQWSPTGDLLFISDRSNWWNIYSYNTYNKHTEFLLDMPAEFATPQWVFGMSTYGFLNSYTLFCTYTQHGQWFIGTLDLMTHHFTAVDSPFTHIEGIHCEDDRDTAVFIGANSKSFPEIIRWQHQGWKSIVKSSSLTIAEDDISTPKNITFTNSQQQDVYGFFYPPANAHYQGSAEEKPPLIVICHGGPTGATSHTLTVKIQFWTNRGFAVFDINYSGSTGYGRDYRRRLYPQWGINDVDDLCCGAEFLIAEGLVDKDRIAIRGSSAGGYSVLAALTFRNTFKAGASLYGIGDLSSLAEETHKFESRYLDQLIGKYPEERARYQQRSPLHHVDQLNCPVIFLQGLDDKVVPPNQAQMMVDALHKKGIPVAHVTFEGEGHGFHIAKNIRYALDVEYAFYVEVLGLPKTDDLTFVPFIHAMAHTTNTTSQSENV